MFRYAVWVVYYPVSLVFGMLAISLSPILAACVRKEYRFDTVKRFGKKRMGFDRYYLWQCLNWFQTHDNACDEYYWGCYGSSKDVSVATYDSSRLLRYWYRVCWLARNPAYGFNYSVLGAEPPAWQVKKKLNIGFGWYLDINIGWKAHKGFTRLMYAGRLIQIPRRSV